MDGRPGPLRAAPRSDRFARKAGRPPAPVQAEAPAGTLDIQAMSRRFGVSYRTLHYYEQLELLSPIRRGRWRHFTRRDCLRLALILKLRGFGFRLEEIRQWLLVCEAGGAADRQRIWQGMAEKRIGDLERQRAELDQKLAELRGLGEAAVLVDRAGGSPDRPADGEAGGG